MIKCEYKGGLFILNHRDFQSLNSKNFGKKEGKLYTLDIYEAVYLCEKEKIQILKLNKEICFDEISKMKKFNFLNYIIYKDLKSKGYNVKSGIKYGSTFRVYNKGVKEEKEHSLWLVEPIFDNEKLKMKDMAGKNRIAHSTNKVTLFAIVDSENSVTYIEANWKKMWFKPKA